MFHFMILVWAQTHLTEDWPDYAFHPLEETVTHSVLKNCGVLSRSARHCLNY